MLEGARIFLERICSKVKKLISNINEKNRWCDYIRNAENDKFPGVEIIEKGTVEEIIKWSRSQEPLGLFVKNLKDMGVSTPVALWRFGAPTNGGDVWIRIENGKKHYDAILSSNCIVNRLLILKEKVEDGILVKNYSVDEDTIRPSNITFEFKDNSRVLAKRETYYGTENCTSYLTINGMRIVIEIPIDLVNEAILEFDDTIQKLSKGWSNRGSWKHLEIYKELKSNGINVHNVRIEQCVEGWLWLNIKEIVVSHGQLIKYVDCSNGILQWNKSGFYEYDDGTGRFKKEKGGSVSAMCYKYIGDETQAILELISRAKKAEEDILNLQL